MDYMTSVPNQWECLWSFILFCTFSLLLVWFYFWWEAHNDYSEFNWFLYNRSGEWSDGTVPILAATAAGFTYIAFLMILALCHVAVGQQINLHWLHKIGVTVALLTTAIGVISVTQMWGEEWDVVWISLQATGPFLHIGALAAVTALAWLVAGQMARAEKTRFQVMVLLIYLSVLLTLYFIPLSITSPCIMERGSLKAAPAIIGHQGAPMLAPENTLLSFNRALQRNVSGLEADVTIRLYNENNISLTLYSVNEPWLYSLLWCSGVPSVSSEAPQVLRKVHYPLWLMSPDEYCLIWICTDIISFAVVLGIFIFQKWRMSGMRSYNPEQIMLSAAVRRSSRDVNIMKEKLIFSEVSNGVSSDEPYMENGFNYYTN
ncbi:hypothetical protein cypCar_00028904 [Cyprinus carpio]|nr:hypothetical protein cypCar_00028904 [Cyprinus carpio]